MSEIATVTGSVRPEDLGATLMHEHLMIGYPGWESDSLRPGDSREAMFSRCVDRLEELKGLGVRSMLDPCPADLGRDVEFMAKVAQKANFNLICATGLYKEAEGGAAFRPALPRPGCEGRLLPGLRPLRPRIRAAGCRAGDMPVASHRARARAPARGLP